MALVEIRFLGPPRITIGGEPVILARRKALALLAYLAVTGRPQSRDALATLLWPDAEPRRSHGNLRHLLWLLKGAGLGDRIRARHEEIEFRGDASTFLDVAEFRRKLGEAGRRSSRGTGVRAAEDAALAAAVEIYRDRFLAGFALRDNFEFDEWQLGREEAFRSDFAGALESLARGREAEGRIDEAIEITRRWLALDPLNEPVQRRLMELYGRAGRRSEALELYDRSAALLGKELGLAPTEETVALRDRVLAEGRRETTESGPPPADLPRHGTPFVGREKELGEIGAVLADPDARLLTLVGPGGFGKTRLAIEAARRRAGAFRDGVFFVPLAPVRDPRFLAHAMTEALRVPLGHTAAEGVRAASGDERRRAALIDFLRGKEALLVLDNLEHLLRGLGPIREILSGAPGVRVLATSRERLGLDGEWVREIDGLPYPEDEASAAMPDAPGAIRLFVECAGRYRRDFAPAADDFAAAARITRVLEGSPLGIELAASWIRALPPAEIAREIESGLDFLRASGDGRPERHRSLRAVFEHSWRLLTEKERRGFARLSILRGPFSREAACDSARIDLETISALVDKSFLRRRDDGAFETHEVLRRYAEEKLRRSPREVAGVVRRLTGHYLERLVRSERGIQGPETKRTLDDLAREVANLRTAWLEAADDGRAEEMTGAFVPFFLFYDIRNRFEEGGEMCARAIDRLGPDAAKTRRIRGLLLVARGWFLSFLAPGRAAAFVDEGMAILGAEAEDRAGAFAAVLAVITGWRGTDGGRAAVRRAVTALEARGDRWGVALALEVLAFSFLREDLDEALRLAQKSMRLRRALGDRWGMALSHYVLGWIAERKDLPLVASRRYRESARLRREIGVDPIGVISCLTNLARVARRTGDFDGALRAHDEALRLARECGNRWITATTLQDRAETAADLGAFDRSAADSDEAREIFDSLDEPERCAVARHFAGHVAYLAGRRDEARFRNDPPPETPDPAISLPEVSAGVVDPWHLLGAGRAALDDGRASEAEGWFAGALRVARAGGDTPAALEIAVEFLRLRHGQSRRDEARALAEILVAHPAIGPARAARVRAWWSENAEGEPGAKGGRGAADFDDAWRTLASSPTPPV